MSDNEEIFENFRQAEINAGLNVEPAKILNPDEVHNFGIDIILKYAEENGFEFCDGSRDINSPFQLVMEKNGVDYIILIKTAAGSSTEILPDNIKVKEAIEIAQKYDSNILFAAVGLHCIGYGKTLVRNQPYKVDFHGFKEIKP